MLLPARDQEQGEAPLGPGWLRDFDRDGDVDLRLLLPSAEPDQAGNPVATCVTGLIDGDAFHTCNSPPPARSRCGLGFELVLLLPALLLRARRSRAERLG